MNSQANPRSAWARRLTTALAMVGLLGAAAAMGGGCVDTSDSTKAEVVCGNGFAKCGDACVDTTLDVANCGACGTACAAGELCSAGVCGLDCLGGTTKCDATCVDTMLDVANCGACGTKCAAGEVCSKGACALECNGGTTKCDAKCVDTKLDIANCGGCGTKCAAGEVCSDGACGTSCAGGSTLCDSACVTTDSDPSNCGDCGTMCAAATNAAGVCVAGSCGYACSAGFADCDASGSNGCEIDTKTDANNCGACANACHFDNASTKCTAGACALDTCNAGFSDCDSNTVNGCEVDTKSDTANCGGCGNACAANEFCSAGSCGAVAACFSGSDPKNANVTYVVCSADASSAWLSAVSGGQYHAEAICKSLGYAALGQFGGTCGKVCGYCGDGAPSCSQTGSKTFDGGGNKGSDDLGTILGATVTWECTNP